MGVQILHNIIKASKGPPPPRDNVAEFYKQINTKELDNNLKLHGCPSEFQDKVKEAITDYRDVFCEYVFQRPTWGF